MYSWGSLFYEIVPLSPVTMSGISTYTFDQQINIALLDIHKHTLFHCALLCCTPQMVRFLQIEGKTLHQQKK